MPCLRHFIFPMRFGRLLFNGMMCYHSDNMKTKSLPLLAVFAAIAAFAFPAFDAEAQDSAGQVPAETPENAAPTMRELTFGARLVESVFTTVIF